MKHLSGDFLMSFFIPLTKVTSDIKIKFSIQFIKQINNSAQIKIHTKLRIRTHNSTQLSTHPNTLTFSTHW